MTGECFCWCWSLWLAIHRCAVPACVCVCACWEYPLNPAIGCTWDHGAAAAWLVWGYWIWQPLTLFLHKPRECFLFPAFLESIHTLPTCSRHNHRRQNKLSNVSVLFKKSFKWVSFAAWGIQLHSKANSLNVTFYHSALCLLPVYIWIYSEFHWTRFGATYCNLAWPWAGCWSRWPLYLPSSLFRSVILQF